MNRIFLILILCLAPFGFSAQTTDEVYIVGKRHYDAKEYAAAVAKFEEAAKSGNVKAIYRLGRCYEQGKGVEADAKKAMTLYEEAAAKGHAKSQYQAGRGYEKGDGVRTDEKKAFEYYAAAAAQGYDKAQYQLAKFYKKGIATGKDLKQAFNLYTQSANQGYAKAQLAVGKCYLEGKGVGKDMDEAKKWLHKAVNNPEDGHSILQDLKKQAKQGDRDSREVLELLAKE